MSGKLLYGPPKPRPKWPLYVALGLMWAGSVVGAGGAGYVIGYEATDSIVHEAAVAQEQLEQCLSADRRLSWNATLAGYLLLDMQQFQRQQLEYAELVTAPRHYGAEGP